MGRLISGVDAMTNFPPTDTVEPHLELAKTRLRVVDGELQRLGANGVATMRLPLREVASVQGVTVFEPICLIIAGAAVALIWIAAAFSQSNLLSCILFAVAVILLGFALMGMVGRYIRISTIDGGQVAVQVNDLNDEAEGFVVSVRRLLPSKNEQIKP
jgi:hypothetical protein